MLYPIYQEGCKEPVANVTCDPADFHPKVSRVACLLIHKAKAGTILYVKVGRDVVLTAKKKNKRIIG
jgi:hypothetical protein